MPLWHVALATRVLRSHTASSTTMPKWTAVYMGGIPMIEDEVDTEASVPTTNGEVILSVSITGGVEAVTVPGLEGGSTTVLFKASLPQIKDCKLCPTAPMVHAVPSLSVHLLPPCPPCGAVFCKRPFG